MCKMRTPEFLSLTSSPPQIQTHLSDCCCLASSFELSKKHFKLNIYNIYMMDNSYFALGDISPSLLPFIQANSLELSSFSSSFAYSTELIRKSCWLYTLNIFPVWALLTLSTPTTKATIISFSAGTNVKISYLFSLLPSSPPASA